MQKTWLFDGVFLPGKTLAYLYEHLIRQPIGSPGYMYHDLRNLGTPKAVCLAHFIFSAVFFR